MGFLLLVCCAGLPALAADTPVPVVADGIITFDRVLDHSCLAVRVEVPEDMAVSGLRWFNGSPDPGFSEAYVSSGADIVPPPMSEAISLADGLAGLQEDWSEVAFNEPIASSSGSLFLVLQYPESYAPTEGLTPVGVGYKNEEAMGDYFISDDGSEWIKVASGCRLLMEPVFCLRDSTMQEKSALQDEKDPKQNELPKKLGVAVYPNPFNPIAHIQLALPGAVDCSLKIYDLRGRRVKYFQVGYLPAGYHTFTWDGSDDRGQSSSSGVYFAQVKAGDKTLNHRLIMVK